MTDRTSVEGTPLPIEAAKRSALARLRARRRAGTSTKRPMPALAGSTEESATKLSSGSDQLSEEPGVGAIDTCASVDGLAVIFFNPSSLRPFLIFVSEGLAAMTGRETNDLLGQNPAVLFADAESLDQLNEMQRTLLPPEQTTSDDTLELDLPTINMAPNNTAPNNTAPRNKARGSEGISAEGSTPANHDVDIFLQPETKPEVDIDLSDSGLESNEGQSANVSSVTREFVAAQHLQSASGDTPLVHATYSVVPSMSLAAPYVLVQFRDLAKQSAEQLVADQPSVVGSLGRGQELGLLCHQVCSQIERELGNGSQAWLALVGQAGNLEPIVRGDFSFDTVTETLSTIAEASSEPTVRVVSFEGLPASLAQTLRQHGGRAVWFVPIMSNKGRLLGALGVVSKKSQLDPSASDRLERYATAMATAIERSSAEIDAAHQSLHDPLTHLPNRALIVDRLSQATARLDRDGIALSVLLVDIDHFKSINDTWGVEVGDTVLLEVADRLLSAVRLGDTVGRISSDQYLVLCVADRGELRADAVAHRILTSLAQPIDVGPTGELRVTASVGVVVVDEAGSSPAAIIGQAESALAKATASGRGRFVTYKAGLNSEVLERQATEQALHRALINNEFVVDYQPIIELRNGFMVGAEALIRWERPGFGLLYPGAFIEIAEQSDLIVDIGRWVIDKVCEDLGSWPKSHGRSPMVSVNLAARQLPIDTLVPSIVSALRRNGLHPNRLGFEITESMGISDLAAVDRNLGKLSELGCRIAIDDFGIGHATLDYLRRFSMADVLKIDRSFIAGLGASREDSAIVHASIALASSLGLQVIAEGVENVDQLADLQELGCRFAQGFGLGKPVTLDQVLETWNKGRVYRPDELGL